MRRRREDGFTLIEVMITTLILVIVLGAASTLFVNLMRAYKQQSKVAETSMEGLVGLEVLRRDIQHAGFGLPWTGVTGTGEATGEANAVACNAALTANPPRAIQGLDSAGSFSSDYLVVRAANVGTAPASGKWTTLAFGTVTRAWGSAVEDLVDSDRVIVLSPGIDNLSYRTLVTGAGAFWNTFDSLGSFAPGDTSQTYLVYGIGEAGNLRMPFNRADYYIDTSSVPVHCAPNTGVLVKAVVSQDNGALSPIYPLLDCVRTVKYRYRLDTNGDGAADMTTATAGDLAGMTAAQIRDQLKEVQVFILGHDGQRDPAYTHSPNPVNVGGTNVNVDVHYRWRLYRMTIRPLSLRG